MSHLVNLNIVNKYLSENSFLSIKCDGDDVSTSYLNFTKYLPIDFFVIKMCLKFKLSDLKKSVQRNNTVIRDKIKVR